MFQDWSNALDYVDTPESFGTIALHDNGLQDLLDNVVIDVNEVQLTKDQKYIAKAMGTALPFLPVHTFEEKKLFTTLCLEHGLNIQKITKEWMNHVDGIKIYPKLSVSIRTYHEKWKKNNRVKDAIQESKKSLKQLKQLFNVADNYFSNSQNSEVEENIFANEMPADPSNVVMNPLPPTAKPATETEVNNSQIVGGVMIGMPQTLHIAKKKFRGKDVKQRKKRICAYCSLNYPSTATACRGRGGAKFCEHRID